MSCRRVCDLLFACLCVCSPVWLARVTNKRLSFGRCCGGGGVVAVVVVVRRRRPSSSSPSLLAVVVVEVGGGGDRDFGYPNAADVVEDVHTEVCFCAV